MKHRVFIPVCSIVICVCGVVPFLAQSRRPQDPNRLFGIASALSDFQPHLVALGDRVRRPGKELTVMNGEFVDAAGNRSSARLTHQVPNLVRLEGFKQRGVLTFDGQSSHGSAALSAVDEDIIETFAEDLPEGLFDGVQRGSALRVLGRGFRSKSSSTAAAFDVFELMGSGATRNDRRVRAKRFFFDSRTALLTSTRYQDARGTRIEVRFSGWGQINGSTYPQKIERYENGRLIFSFAVASVSAGPRQDTEPFKKP